MSDFLNTFTNRELVVYGLLASFAFTLIIGALIPQDHDQ